MGTKIKAYVQSSKLKRRRKLWKQRPTSGGGSFWCAGCGQFCSEEGSLYGRTSNLGENQLYCGYCAGTIPTFVVFEDPYARRKTR